MIRILRVCFSKNINKVNKRTLQSFPDSLLKYSREINKTNDIQKNKKNQKKTSCNKIDELTIPQFIISREKFTEREKEYCEYCKGCGIIICLECEISNKMIRCHKCNGHKYNKCYICDGSGKSHRLF